MKNIVRDNFKGGLLGKAFHFKPREPGYAQSLVEAKNVLIDPYGQVTRRPPLVSVGTILSITEGSTLYYPKDARAIEFVYSAEFRYVVVFVVYEADGEEDITRAVIQSADGVEKSILPVPYTQLEVLELDTHHSNDTMWIAHQNHAPRELIRQSDELWSIQRQEFTGGPFLEENEDQTQTVRTGMSPWYEDITYEIGDRVLPKSSVTFVANWIGTQFSHLEQYPTEFDFVAGGFDPYYQDRSTVKGGSVFVATVNDTEYPYLIIRIDNTTDPTPQIGQTISIDCSFVEDGEDLTYTTSGELISVHTIASGYLPTPGRSTTTSTPTSVS